MKRILLDVEDSLFDNGMLSLTLFGVEDIGNNEAHCRTAASVLDLSEDFNHVIIGKDGNPRIGHFELMDVLETLIPNRATDPPVEK